MKTPRWHSRDGFFKNKPRTDPSFVRPEAYVIWKPSLRQIVPNYKIRSRALEAIYAPRETLNLQLHSLHCQFTSRNSYSKIPDHVCPARIFYLYKSHILLLNPLVTPVSPNGGHSVNKNTS